MTFVYSSLDIGLYRKCPDRLSRSIGCEPPRRAGLFSSLGESAKLRARIGGFPEKAPYAGLETGAPREN